ncbi:MAG: NAD(P)(+) transhydrogenase (Re/Si-specific) subunit beta [Bacteroidales bacterium]|nr:NAD(P)(+) transhydrogenase (Re/Si-specific) subunit beta [Bacteroidales bacterium]
MNEIFHLQQSVDYTTAQTILEYSYLLSAVFFVVGLKLQNKPDTARAGNIWAGVGMFLATIATIILDKDSQGHGIKNLGFIIISIVAAGVIGTYIARKVKMTAMPQLVSFFNATGGAASAIISFRGFFETPHSQTGTILVSLLGVLVGSVAFTGSMIAYGKLEGKVGDIRAGFMKFVNLALLIVSLAMIVVLMILPEVTTEVTILMYGLFFISLLYGVLFVMPIGGADMPVVISLLNAFTGIAAALTGFLYSNYAMILGGILVGAAGTILTIVMCNAMNRSLWNVILGGFGGSSAVQGDAAAGIIREIQPSDAAVLMSYSSKVTIVPGYGLAVSQAQHTVHELEKLLESKGVTVKYAIHPVAGRMPGHMNVLLAEADVSYDKLVEMDDINPEMEHTDVVVIIGANDVVNPSAVNVPGSPIYGMPIIRADLARNIIVMKRGMGKGYAGIENPLFFLDHTRMLFGNAKDSLNKLISEIKTL